MSDTDLSLVPKSVTDGGKTLTLGAVEWSGSEDGHYTAVATYTGTSSSKYATGYKVTANYAGQVSKTDCEVVTYTAIFGSEKIAEDIPAVVLPDPTDPDVPIAADMDAPTVADMDWLSLLGCAGGVSALTLAAVWGVQNLKKRRTCI